MVNLMAYFTEKVFSLEGRSKRNTGFGMTQVFGPEKPFVKLRPAYCVKLVFSHVVKGIKIKIIAKFRASRRLRFEDTKRIMSPEKFRDFRETGPRPFPKSFVSRFQ